ncbi:MAG: NAD(P)/FAD-dependent oxidoreductase [Gemmatimonadetes bacterium]|nr:NAD(P)/FAD-dependent oxidoreductase [Gemmatimonadota bacterium]
MGDSVDVLVVGAGLAGLETARRLGRVGLDVALVDRKADPGAGVHTTGIFVRKSLEDFEFPAQALGPPIRRVDLLAPGGRSVSLRSDRDEFRVGRMADLYRLRLADVRQIGVRWWPNHTWISGRADGDGTRVTLAARGTIREVTARMVIGADGARSAVAEFLGLDRNRTWIVGIEEVWQGVPLEGEPRFWCWIDPVHAPGYLAWAVHDGQELHFGTGGYQDRFDPGASLAVIRDRVHGVLDLGRGVRVERRGGLIPVGGVLGRIASPRGLLVGDAAGAPSPLTAGGLDPCLRLAALASDVVARYLGTRSLVELARYDGRRFRARFVSRLLMRRLFGALRSPAAVDLAFRLLATGAGRRFAQHVFFGRGSFPDVGAPLTVRDRVPAAALVSGGIRDPV